MNNQADVLILCWITMGGDHPTWFNG